MDFSASAYGSDDTIQLIPGGSQADSTDQWLGRKTSRRPKVTGEKSSKQPVHPAAITNVPEDSIGGIRLGDSP